VKSNHDTSWSNNVHKVKTAKGWPTIGHRESAGAPHWMDFLGALAEVLTAVVDGRGYVVTTVFFGARERPRIDF
jgi:hypothetical protein